VNVLGNDTLVLTRRPESWTDRFSGKMGDVWGDHEDNMRYLDEERASWSERFPDLELQRADRFYLPTNLMEFQTRHTKVQRMQVPIQIARY